MVASLPIVMAAGLVASSTRQEALARRAERLARDPDATEEDMRRALRELATGYRAHALLTRACVEALCPPAGERR